MDLQNDAVRSEMATERAREASIDEEVTALVKTFGELMDDQRYKEAEVVAKQVAELKPDDPIAVTMSHVARTKTRILMDQEIREKGQDAFLDTMIGIQRSANVFDPNNELTFDNPEDWATKSRARLGGERFNPRLSASEQMIQRKMSTGSSI